MYNDAGSLAGLKGRPQAGNKVNSLLADEGMGAAKQGPRLGRPKSTQIAQGIKHHLGQTKHLARRVWAKQGGALQHSGRLARQRIVIGELDAVAEQLTLAYNRPLDLHLRYPLLLGYSPFLVLVRVRPPACEPGSTRR